MNGKKLRSRKLRGADFANPSGAMKRSSQEIQRAPDHDSGRTKLALLYQLLGWKCVFTLACLIVAGTLQPPWWRTSNHHDLGQECLRRAGNVSDITSRLLHQSLTTQLEEMRDENLRLKGRAKKLQQMYEEEVKKGQERIKDLQSYREGEVERKERERQDLVTSSEGLKSQLEDTRNEVDILKHRNMELQQKYNIQIDEGRKHVEELDSCQADLTSKYTKLQGLENEIHVSQEKHDKELQAEQEKCDEELRVQEEHKLDELEKKDKEIVQLKQLIQDKNGRILTLTSVVDSEKRKRENERAQCDRTLEDLRSTQNKGWLWSSMTFGAGGALLAIATFFCIGCIASATQTKH